MKHLADLLLLAELTSVLWGRKSQNLKSLDHFWHVPTLWGDLSWRPCQRFHRLTLLIWNWAQALREGEGAHIGVQLCPISAFSTEKFNWPARGTYSTVYRRKSTYKKVKPTFVIFHFESGNQDHYRRKIDADSTLLTSYLSQLSVIIKVSSLTYPVVQTLHHEDDRLRSPLDVFNVILSFYRPSI